MTASHQKVTQALLDAGHGDADADARLWALVYHDLRGLAAPQLQRERSDHTFSPTALVHEVYLRLVDQTQVDWKNRAHFFSVAARMMRRILVDYARRHQAEKHQAEKRGGPDRHPTELGGELSVDPHATAWLLYLDRALDRLGRSSERLSRVIECKYFSDMTDAEVAQVLGVSLKTVQRDWIKAQVLLAEVLSGEA